MIKKCGSCKYFEQGLSCSFCGNPNQNDKSKKEYLYYNFSCPLWVEGISQSRKDYMNKKGIFKNKIYE